MNNTKFLNKVKEFAENFNKGYEVSKFKLDKPYEESILLATSIGGSSGGDCWGGSTSDYQRNEEQIQDNLKSELSYTISELKEFFNSEIDFSKYVSSISRYNNIDTESSDYDYYGNHTEYGLYEVSLYPIMKDCLSNELFQVFKSYWSNRKNEITKIFEDEKRNEIIKELESKIENFEKTKENELTNLKINLQNYKRMVESLEKSLNDFATKKTTELKHLKSSLDKLTNETSEQKTKQKKKM